MLQGPRLQAHIMQGAQVPFLARELDPTCHNKDPHASEKAKDPLCYNYDSVQAKKQIKKFLKLSQKIYTEEINITF